MPEGAPMSEVLQGACLCGRVAVEVHEPELLAACHCTRCQRWGGGSGTTVVAAAAKNVKITKGQDVLKRYQEEGFADRHFCGNCGSGVYVVGGEKYYVSAAILKNVTMKLACHIQVASKAPWDEIGGNAPQFPEWPPS
jgi:hypothetical protein